MKEVLLAAALSTLPIVSLGQTTGAAFLNINPSARAYSMGMANTLSSLGAQAFGANPANLGLIESRVEVFSSYASLIDGTQYEHIAAAFSSQAVPGLDSLGMAVTSLQGGGFQGADGQGSRNGSSFSTDDLAVSVGGAGRLSPDLRLGFAVKAIRSRIAGYQSNTALAADVGMTYTFAQFSRPVSLGVSITNAGQSQKFLDQTDPLPTSLNLGAAMPVGPVVLVAELDRSFHDQSLRVGTGLEVALGPVALRGGFLMQNNPDPSLAQNDQGGLARILGGVSAGFGLRLGSSANIDYAISQQAVEYGATHRLSLTLRWGSPRERATVRLDDGLDARQTARKNSADRSEWMIIQ